MATQIITSRARMWTGSRDREGHRTYKIKWLIESDTTDGPANVLQTAGLPLPGSYWQFSNDIDLWAFCQPDAEVEAHQPQEGDPTRYWSVTQTFTTKPPDFQRQRCNDVTIEDPLLEPAKVSGTFVQQKVEGVYDRFGRPIMSSSFEQLRGPQNEWNDGNQTVRIEQNVATQTQAVTLPANMMNTVNVAALWGMPRRCLLLVNRSFEKLYYGTCFGYYKRTLEFEVNAGTFDRNLLDEGTKALRGHWNNSTGAYVLDQINGANPSPYNPAHFVRFKDRNEENCNVLLNGGGLPAEQVIIGNTFYVSISDNSLNHPITEAGYWIPVVGSIGPQPWDATVSYVRGNLVTIVVTSSGGVVLPGGQIGGLIAASYTFICLSPNTNSQPTLSNANWFNVTNLNDQGTWKSTRTYFVGDYVNQGITTGIGRIHVEKYNEADFLALGIPTIL